MPPRLATQEIGSVRSVGDVDIFVGKDEDGTPIEVLSAPDLGGPVPTPVELGGPVPTPVEHEGIAAILRVQRKDRRIRVVVRSLKGDDVLHVVTETKPPPARVCEMFVQAAEALAFLHDSGIVHGALAPKSLRLVGSRVIVVDLAVAILAGPAARRSAPSSPLLSCAPSRASRTSLRTCSRSVARSPSRSATSSRWRSRGSSSGRAMRGRRRARRCVSSRRTCAGS